MSWDELHVAMRNVYYGVQRLEVLGSIEFESGEAARASQPKWPLELRLSWPDHERVLRLGYSQADTHWIQLDDDPVLWRVDRGLFFRLQGWLLGLEAEPRANCNDTGELAELVGDLHRRHADELDLLTRHLGTCLDACHAAVEFEEPEQALANATAAGTPLASSVERVRVKRETDCLSRTSPTMGIFRSQRSMTRRPR